MKDLVIIGAGGFGREVAWLAEEINSVDLQWNLLGFIDDDDSKQGVALNGYPVIGPFEKLKVTNNIYAVCAVGATGTKKALVEKAADAGLRFANLIHPDVQLSRFVELGCGNIICAGTIITVNIKIGNHVIINLDCTVGHDTVIGDYVTCAPAVNISGQVEIEEGCDIGTNTAIIQGKKIGRWSIIGAGAVVSRDIPPSCTAVGVPAKPISFQGESF